MTKLCPDFTRRGACTKQSCPYKHRVSFCEQCRLDFPSAEMLASHLRSKGHRNKTAVGGLEIVQCPTCEKNVRFHDWASHLSSKAHRTSLNSGNSAATAKPREPVIASGQKLCPACKTIVQQTDWDKHAKSKAHRKNGSFSRYRAALDQDKNGVKVSKNGDFGLVDIEEAKAGQSVDLLIENTLPNSRITIVEAQLGSTGKTSSPGFSTVLKGGQNRPLVYNSPKRLAVTFRQNHLGRYSDRVDVAFLDSHRGRRFVISRPLHAIVGNKKDHDLLKPVSPYVPPVRSKREIETEIVPGERPESLNAIPWVMKLPVAAIPKGLHSTLSGSSPAEVMKTLQRAFLPSTLTHKNYGRHFQVLLWIEEFQMELDLGRYAISNATLTKKGRSTRLSVPGLAEKRPSVLVGDRILVQKPDAKPGHWFEGFVHHVLRDEVTLGFHQSFSPSTSMRYKVHFKLNRYPLRRQHQALRLSFSPSRILFPVSGNARPVLNLVHVAAQLRPINRLIADNKPQRMAVASILHQDPNNIPFIIFGPPGTGKTVTVVEAILQILKHRPNAHILACAPSNSAADIIAIRLSALSTEELLRFYAPTRPQNAIPQELLPYSLFKNGTYSCPAVPVLNQYRVVVSTCVSAAFAFGTGMKRGHFSHIFIDEAGQATEPEVMIPIRGIADDSTNIILSGDPRQLGPVIRSKYACELGLQTSYLERLMALDIYDERAGNHKTVVKLIKNFRSHSAILRFPNERFYGGDLQPWGDPKTINYFVGSPILPSPNFPLVFHAINGKDDRESTSPSFFNIDEVTLVKEYVQKLRSDRKFLISTALKSKEEAVIERPIIEDDDIGIIAPYHAQCLKIRLALKGVSSDIKVGSVEEFQGQERLVIIISTVRSSRDFIRFDLRHTLGFVANPRRFNVSVTRAKALVIVVGDPVVLSLDPLWRSFLNYIHVSGGWRGPPPPWNTEDPVEEAGGYDQALRERGWADMDDFTRRMEELTLARVEESDDNIPWREPD